MNAGGERCFDESMPGCLVEDASWCASGVTLAGLARICTNAPCQRQVQHVADHTQHTPTYQKCRYMAYVIAARPFPADFF